jgi:hypothetical protein
MILRLPPCDPTVVSKPIIQRRVRPIHCIESLSNKGSQAAGCPVECSILRTNPIIFTELTLVKVVWSIRRPWKVRCNKQVTSSSVIVISPTRRAKLLVSSSHLSKSARENTAQILEFTHNR